MARSLTINVYGDSQLSTVFIDDNGVTPNYNYGA